MTPVTVEGVELFYVPTIHGGVFDCKDCALKEGDRSCVRIKHDTGELFFETYGNDNGKLFCISTPNDVVFIKNTPKQIAKYVAARLEST